MKKLMLATMALTMAMVSCANGKEEVVDSQNWRITAGGFARGSMKAKIGNMSERTELYGGDLDLYYRAFEMGRFSLWTGIGGTFTPYQDVSKQSIYERDASDPMAVIELGVDAEAEVGYGEFRMLLVPEYEVRDGWNIGGRIGVAFDWLKARGSLSTWSQTTINIPGIPSTVIPVGPFGESEDFSDFTAQAILGLQTTYFFTDNVGLYGAIDYRVGDEAEFKKGGEKYGSLDMDGWCVSAGIAVQF